MRDVVDTSVLTEGDVVGSLDLYESSYVGVTCHNMIDIGIHSMLSGWSMINDIIIFEIKRVQST